MMLRAALLASCYFAGDGVRVSDVETNDNDDTIVVMADNDEDDMTIEDLMEPTLFDPDHFAQMLVKTFSDPKEFSEDRETLAFIRDHEIQGGSSGDTRKFEYLGTDCMKQRMKWAAKRLGEHGCKRILEVGGFLAPLYTTIPQSEMPTVEMYVDVDPSATSTAFEYWNGTVPAVTLKITLDEFRMKTITADKVPVGKMFDCFLQLGTSKQNLGGKKRTKAFKDAIGKVEMMIVEYPESNANDTPALFMPVVDEVGLIKVEKKTVDCSQDKKSLELKDKKCGNKIETTSGIYEYPNNCLVRHVEVFKKNTTGSGKEAKKMEKKEKKEKKEGKLKKQQNKEKKKVEKSKKGKKGKKGGKADAGKKGKKGSMLEDFDDDN